MTWPTRSVKQADRARPTRVETETARNENATTRRSSLEMSFASSSRFGRWESRGHISLTPNGVAEMSRGVAVFGDPWFGEHGFSDLR